MKIWWNFILSFSAGLFLTLWRPDFTQSSFPFSCSLQGSPQQIIFLHLTQSSESSSLTATDITTSFTPSTDHLSGLPVGLLPGSSHLIILLLIYSLPLCAITNTKELVRFTYIATFVSLIHTYAMSRDCFFGICLYFLWKLKSNSVEADWFFLWKRNLISLVPRVKVI